VAKPTIKITEIGPQMSEQGRPSHPDWPVGGVVCDYCHENEVGWISGQKWSQTFVVSDPFESFDYGMIRGFIGCGDCGLHSAEYHAKMFGDKGAIEIGEPAEPWEFEKEYRSDEGIIRVEVPAEPWEGDEKREETLERLRVIRDEARLMPGKDRAAHVREAEANFFRRAEAEFNEE